MIRRLRQHRAVLLHGSAIVGGWALLTLGLSLYLDGRVWSVSVGLFLLGLAGFGHLRTLFGTGLYALTRRE